MKELSREELERALSEYQAGTAAETAGELLARHYRLFVRRVLPRDLTASERDDLTQEVLSRVFLKWRQIQPDKGAMDVYYYRTAKSVYADLLRSRIRKRKAVQRFALDPTSSKHVSTPEDQALKEESDESKRSRAAHALTMLESLSPRQQQVMKLRILGLKELEIAARLRLARGTVKAHLFEARKRLRGLVP